MKQILKISGRLAIICLISALALALVNSITSPVIAEGKAIELEKALSKLKGTEDAGDYVDLALAQGDWSEFIGNVKGYYPIGKKGSYTGYIIKTAGQGYAGDVVLLAYVSKTGEILGVISMENSETPGLGSKAAIPSYMNKFIGTGADKAVPVRKTMLIQNDADAVTGASVTFNAVAKALEKASTLAKTLGGK